MILRRIIGRVLPRTLKDRLKYLKKKLDLSKYRKKQRRIIEEIRLKHHVNVMIIASSMGMWRFDEFCRQVLKDSSFSLLVVIKPFLSYIESEQENETKRLTNYLSGSNIPFVVVDNGDNAFRLIKQRFKPDLIFYPQPYGGAYGDETDWSSNMDCLLCYLPYSLHLTSLNWCINTDYHNLAWRQYQPSKLHAEESAKKTVCKGDNVVIAGEPRHDDFQTPAVGAPWNKLDDGLVRKKLIWAPHFQIMGDQVMNRMDFLRISGLMIKIAEMYSDSLQIAFKPHPRLKTSLYRHQEWGKKKTDEYYAMWASMKNTQLEEGEYVDLFKTSDALIHNCGSFTGEYLYLKKPVAYVTMDVESIKAPMHEFGKRCVDSHYIVSDDKEIIAFIEDVVIGGNDTMREFRQGIYDMQMVPPNNSSVAENIVNDIRKSLIE